MNKQEKIKAIKAIDPTASGLSAMTAAQVTEVYESLKAELQTIEEDTGSEVETIDWDAIRAELMDSMTTEQVAAKHQKALVWAMMQHDLIITDGVDAEGKAVHDVHCGTTTIKYEDSRGNQQEATAYALQQANSQLLRFHADLQGRKDEPGFDYGNIKRNFNKRLRDLSKDKGIPKCQLHGSKSRGYYIEAVKDERVEWDDLTPEQQAETGAEKIANAITDKVADAVEFSAALRAVFDQYASIECTDVTALIGEAYDTFADIEAEINEAAKDQPAEAQAKAA